jgi:hypothetical protein
MALDGRGAEPLFQVLTEREEKNSVAIASNESFGKAHMFARTCARQRRKFTGSPSCGTELLALAAVEIWGAQRHSRSGSGLWCAPRGGGLVGSVSMLVVPLPGALVGDAGE